jgi:hypothetical protein
VEYVGIDSATRRAAWCALNASGEIVGEGVISADLDWVLRLVSAVGREVQAAIEMMSGAAWVAETLEAAGWRVQVADSRRARALARLAAKTDRIDARALAELVRRDLVPVVWVPPFADRALLEQLLRRMHPVRLRSNHRSHLRQPRTTELDGVPHSAKGARKRVPAPSIAAEQAASITYSLTAAGFRWPGRSPAATATTSPNWWTARVCAAGTWSGRAAAPPAEGADRRPRLRPR